MKVSPDNVSPKALRLWKPEGANKPDNMIPLDAEIYLPDGTLDIPGSLTVQDTPVQSAFTIVVAASNAGTIARAQAKYTCDGIADEVQINAAFADLPANGGTVVLSEGTFDIAAVIAPVANSVLRGQGRATKITQATAFTAIKATVNFATLKDFWLYGTVGAVNGNGIETGGTDWVIDGVIVENVSYTGVFINHARTTLVNSQILGNGAGGSSVNGPGVQITSSATYARVAFNYIGGNYANGIDINGGYNSIVGNISRSNGQGGAGLGDDRSGILLTGTSAIHNEISGNVCEANPAEGIMIKSSSVRNGVTGNSCKGNSGSGIRVDTDNNQVTGNTCEANSEDGIETAGGGGTTITGNQCSHNSRYGINLNSSNLTVVGNVAGNNSSHGILVNDNYAIIALNQLVSNGGWGILIQAGTGHRLMGNRGAGNTSGNLSDSGTSTFQRDNTWNSEAKMVTLFPVTGTGSISLAGGQVPSHDLTGTQYVAFAWQVPDTFKALSVARIWYVANGATGTFDWTINTRFTGSGENIGTSTTDSATADGQAATVNINNSLDVISAFDGLAAIDSVGVKFTVDALGTITSLGILGLELQYTVNG